MDIRYDRITVGIEKYQRIMQRVRQTDVSADDDFQKLYNGFYRLRQRPASFYKCYYAYMEEQKDNQNLTFGEVLHHLYEETGEIHASFSSKLLATINPNMPVWDKFVMKNLGLRAPYTYQKNRVEKTIAIYDAICQWYKTEEADVYLAEFNTHFPDVEMTDVKKIDWILWGRR